METHTTQILTAAEELCRRRGVRFTELRRRVLEIVCRRREPQGAYDILDVLRQDGRGGRHRQFIGRWTSCFNKG